ncbi:hypothetical protein Tco_0265404 [Tanacetum coccineum]
MTTNTPYPSRKIRRIRACTYQKTTKEKSSIRHIQRRPIHRIEDIVCEDSGRYQSLVPKLQLTESAIDSASSSSKCSWSESRLKSGDLNSSRLRVLKCLLDDRNSHSGSLRSILRIQWKRIRCIDQLNEYAVLDKELDTPYGEYDLAHLKLVFEFSIYKVWKSVRYGVSKDWIRRIELYSSVVFDKDRYNANIRATNILLQGLPKDIYSLINHYTNAKDIGDHVKSPGRFEYKNNGKSQLYELRHFGRFVTALKLNRGLRDSNYDQLYAYLKQHENRGQGNNARGAGTSGYGGAQNRVGNANLCQAWQVKCYNYNGIGHIARNCTQPKRPQNSEYFKDKNLLQLVDEDDEQPCLKDLALNVDNMFQADDCDAFNSDVDEAPMAQTMFMANLSSADPVYDEVGPSYDLDILSKVHDHDQYQDAVCEHHEEHEMHDDVQPNYVVDSHADYTSDSNMIMYDQYVKDNAVPVVQSNVSSVPNDAYMMIYIMICMNLMPNRSLKQHGI